MEVVHSWLYGNRFENSLGLRECLQGLTLLDAKNQLLLTYLSYLAYYVLLKTHGLPINNHPVIERLIEVKLLIQKLQPLERAVKPEIDRLVEIARKGRVASLAFVSPCLLVSLLHLFNFFLPLLVGPSLGRSAEAGDSSSVPSIRARPEAFVPVGAEDSSSASDGEREEGAEASEQDEEDSDREAEAAGDGSTSKYRPPKMMAVEFTGDKVRRCGLFSLHESERERRQRPRKCKCLSASLLM